VATDHIITIETSEVQFDWSTGNQKLVFTCCIESEFGEVFDPYIEETMQMVARELLTQAKILTALTQKD